MSAHNLLMAAAGAASTPPDPQFNYVTMLLHGDGTNGAQNNTFVDSSSNALSITRNGNTTQGTFTPFSAPEGYWGISSENAGTISHASGVSSTFAGWGGRTRTFECWVYRNSASEGVLQGAYAAVAANGRWYIYIGSNNKLGIQWTTGTGSETGVQGTIDVPVGQWAHIAVCVNSTTSSNTTIYFCVNGAISTSTGNNFSTQTSTFGWGAMFASGQYMPAQFQGLSSNIRWSSNIRYSGSSYTVPTARFTTDANTFFLFNDTRAIKDSSGNNYNPSYSVVSVPRSPFSFTREAYSPSVNGGSAYFDGSGDYLTTPSSATLSNFSGDFTVEGWVYLTATTTYGCFVGGNGASGWYVEYGSSRGFGAYDGSSFLSGSSSAVINQWVHLAITRASGTVRFFVNGALTASTTSSNFNYTQTLAIGGYSNGTSTLSGYLSNVRVVNGSAVYTSAFTPPTAPVTAITNTSLLLNFTNGGIIDNAMMNDLETVGNAQVSTTQKKYGTASMYFDGTGDYLKGSAASAGLIGSGDFTIEGWLYIASLPNAEVSICSTCESGGTGIIFGLAGGGNVNKLQFAIGNLSVGNPTVVDAANMTTGAWVHFAAVRYNGTIYLYKNGTSVGTPTSASAALDRTTVTVGAWPNGGSTLTGYIDDLRITKGYARYTSNFTPPAAALADQ